MKKLFLFMILTLVLYTKTANKIIHIYTVLADSERQFMLNIPRENARGDELNSNYYWGSETGLACVLDKSKDWTLIYKDTSGKLVLERRVYSYLYDEDVFIVADAYKGVDIKEALYDYTRALSGQNIDKFSFNFESQHYEISSGGASDLTVYFGHNILFDINFTNFPSKADDYKHFTIVYTYYGSEYFRDAINKAEATAVLWTYGMMVPEAKTLVSVLTTWANESTIKAVRSEARKIYKSIHGVDEKTVSKIFISGGEYLGR